MVFEVSGIRIQNSEYLYLLLLIPVAVLLWRAALRRKQQLRQELFQDNLPRLRLQRRYHLTHMGVEVAKYVCLSLIMGALVLALAQPQIERERVVEERVGIDTVILLDLSLSMLAEDVVPSRLQKAKEVIRDFIVQKRPEDRIGLVSFAETSLILSYLTRDPENLLFYLDYLQPQYGTNVGRAIKSGLRVFEREDEVRARENGNGERSSNRIIVLLSDGEDHGKELEEAVQSAIESGFRIYCIGIGSRRAVPIPLGLKESGMRRYLQDEDENQIYTRFDQATLRDIAQRTSARFYRAYVGSEMERAFQDILLKEREIKDFKIVTHYQDLYYYFLLSSLGLFLALLTLDRQ